MAGEMENKAIFQLEVQVEVEVGAWQKEKKKFFFHFSVAWTVYFAVCHIFDEKDTLGNDR